MRSRQRRTLSLWHPFSPQAVGLPEAQIPAIHSQPHLAGLRALVDQGWRCRVEYLTDKPWPYRMRRLFLDDFGDRRRLPIIDIVRVINDQRQGFAWAGTFDADVVKETIAEARDNATFAEPDEWSGLPTIARPLGL